MDWLFFFQTWQVSSIVGAISRDESKEEKIKGDTVFRRVHTQVFQLIWIQGGQELFCLFWVICMVHFQLHLGGCLCLNQVDGVEDQKGRQGQVKLVEREDEVWKTGDA